MPRGMEGMAQCCRKFLICTICKLAEGLKSTKECVYNLKRKTPLQTTLTIHCLPFTQGHMVHMYSKKTRKDILKNTF